MPQKKATNATVEENTIVAPIEREDEIVTGLDYQNVIKKLIADGAKKVSNLRIKNVNFEKLDNHTRVSFTLATPVVGYVRNEDTDEWEKKKTNVIYTSLYAISGAIKEDEDLAWLGNALGETPQALNLILNGGSIDIIQQEFEAGESIINPFSNKAVPEAREYDHDNIINNVIKFRLGGTGEKMAMRLADKMMGF